jgi:23S rRNA (cytidine1920-2'-O)/16S rRNA (cytidine1409-2'-O)-methyltransferase
MPKMRLDLLLVERGLAESRAKAQALIMAGEVRVGGEVALKPATSVDAAANVEVAQGPRFVSRGGEKLDAALEAFPLNVRGRICADVGASTGGFTDCLLQRGAAKIYAIDVGKGILHWKLRNDPRVVVMEETNARYVESLPESVSLVTVDASFISLRILLPAIKRWLASPPSHAAPPLNERTSSAQIEPLHAHLGEEGRGLEAGGGGDLIALIKPQFEAGRQDVSHGEGVIRDPFIHRQVLLSVLTFAQSHGFGARGLIRSPLLGPKGNTEFLAWLVLGGEPGDVSELVERGMNKGNED